MPSEFAIMRDVQAKENYLMPAMMEAPRRGFVYQEEAYAPSDSLSPEWFVGYI